MNKEPRVYGSRWEKARISYLRSHPLCVMCQQQGRAVPATVVDHIKPHRLKDAIASGDKQMISIAQKLFWDQDNWQSLCKQHHDSTKQRMEKSGLVPGCDENGFPLDPNSHWHK
ncbi:HNH endonuclease [Martelella alba]|uniref:HNH endonuclease n=1 Tax=Martelella alba TaxID=2590451 RepID=A0ABY2SDT7_9HYPH|nr:HNH endonuclease signature motif containing protein [Martelella alba]TKI02774.1 HNH endonuclease [Martelella alba]